jgi:hypothetical protein
LNLLRVEEQELAFVLADVVDADFRPGGKGNVYPVTLSQLDGVTTHINLDCGASSGFSIVARPLDEMSVDISTLGGVGQRRGGGEDGGESVERGVNGGGTCGLALIDNSLTAFGRCYNMCPFVPFVIVGEVPK